jgi:hypothetical protein
MTLIEFLDAHASGIGLLLAICVVALATAWGDRGRAVKDKDEE